ncbi:SH3 domain-containing protein [Clostridium perfringens]|uniref:SH3 domain-containing protein n=1 Tax=Clostridium perfringens TaxID=1502 RepID=UPI00311AA5DC
MSREFREISININIIFILVNIANSLISKIGDYKAQNGLHGWTVYIAPCMNPDGVIVRGTNNGPGRCAVKSRIDMNRCFPRGFTAQYNSRNYTGPNPLGAQEAVALKEFIEKINRTADELVVIDGHGWLGCTYRDSSIAQYFTKQFGFSHNGPSGGGYFSYWAQGLPRTRGLLLEYPDTYSYGEVISRNYIGKTFNAIINILKNNPNGGSVDSRNSGNGGSTSSEGSSSSADISYTATGEVINVQSFLNVRKGPGTNYDSIGQLHQGEIVNIVAKNEKWYKIKYGSGNAYVNFDYIAIIYNKKISLENWQEDCIKRGCGPITKEAYIEKINAVKLNKCLKDDIDDLVKKNLLRDTFDFLNPSKSDAISFANSLINDSTVRKFNDNRKGIFYFKETYESSARKEMSKFRAYKRLDNGQILRTIDLDIPIDKSKLSVRVKNSVKDVWKIKFLKGIDKVLVPLGFSIAVGTDFSVFLSEDELKSNDEIAAILAAVVVTNGLEILLCSTIGAIATQIIGPEFPIVGAIVGGLAGAFAGYIIGKNLNNIDMERYLKNLILKILSLLE